jgi:hypothetical protein
MVTYKRIRVKTALSKSGLYDLDYAYNPYVGCFHGCVYCYARAYVRDEEVSRNWGTVVYIKENILEVLREEVKRKPRGVVGVSTLTDPYQPIEAGEGLTRRGIQVLLQGNFKVSIQTKSPLVTRDIDILKSYRFPRRCRLYNYNTRPRCISTYRAKRSPSSREDQGSAGSEQGGDTDMDIHWPNNQGLKRFPGKPGRDNYAGGRDRVQGLLRLPPHQAGNKGLNETPGRKEPKHASHKSTLDKYC